MPDHLAAAVAGGARGLHGEDSRRLHDPAVAAAIGADLGPGSRLGPGAAAGVALLVALKLDDLGRVVGGLQEVHLDVAADIGAAAGAAAAAALAEHFAEEPLAEDVAEGGKDVADVVELRGPAAGHPGVAVVVVGRPLVRMAEDLEGLGGLLEFDDGLLVARIAVRVVLQGELAIGFGDLTVAGGTIDAEDLIVIAFGGHRRHGRSDPPLPTDLRLRPERVGVRGFRETLGCRPQGLLCRPLTLTPIPFN